MSEDAEHLTSCIFPEMKFNVKTLRSIKLKWWFSHLNDVFDFHNIVELYEDSNKYCVLFNLPNTKNKENDTSCL